MSGPLVSASAAFVAKNSRKPPYAIEQSLRFNSADSAWLNKTFSSAGSRTTWTFSCWIKGGLKNGNIHEGRIFGVGSDAAGDGQGSIYYSANQLIFYHRIGSGTEYSFGSDARFRDPSAWHHLVVVWDTNNGTAADRWRFYDNGVRLTSATASTLPSGYNSNQNAAVAHGIGVLPTSPAAYFNGYLAEVNFIDGSALDPTDFGEYDENGVWRPIQYAGSYTGNSFYLKFASGDGTDSSGLSNTWTANNFTTSGTGTDVMSDTPTTNWCTLNPVQKAPDANLLDGNLRFSGSVAKGMVCGTQGASTGKYYFEFIVDDSGQDMSVGVTNLDQTNLNLHSSSGGSNIGRNTWSWGLYMYPLNSYIRKVHNFTYTDTSATKVSNGDVIGVAYDAGAGKIWASKNGTWMDSGDPAAGTNALFTNLTGTIAPAVQPPGGGVSTTNTANFGQRAFAYTPPTGFKALNTSNLSAPTVKDGSKYFNTVTYTGDGTSSHAITGVGFQPDWVWLKSRSLAQAGNLIDVVRGVDKYLRSSSTAAEATFAFLSSFDTDGFTLGTSDAGANQSSATYVAWNWLAGGTGSSNTSGSITSTVSVNPTAGFSIVSYTGTLSSTPGTAPTVGHGLGVAPSLIISKSRNATGDDAGNWYVNHSYDHTRYLRLNTTASAVTIASQNGGTAVAPTSTVFSTYYIVGSNVTGNNYVAYCFAEVEGYSKFGSYTGNGSTDGPFIHTGFKVGWWLVKRTDATEYWYIRDTTRDNTNPISIALNPNAADAEYGYGSFDFLSNGVKIRESGTGSNTSGGTYIFMALAENPFGGSGVSPATAR